MYSRLIACLTAMVCTASLAVPTALAGEPRAVLELFTSQGCSSCPAADKLLGELGQDSSLVTLSLPVDYWDYLGWKDTLALHGHTNRERAYAAARGDRQVYTPQIVVNGLVHVLGSDRQAIEQAIEKTRAAHSPLSVPVTVAVANGTMTASVGKADAANTPAKGEVWLCPVTRRIPVEIGRGENHGRNITYHNVVRRWIKLGDWTGEPKTFTLPLSEFAEPEIDTVTVLVQDGVAAKPGMMLGAASASLH